MEALPAGKQDEFSGLAPLLCPEVSSAGNVVMNVPSPARSSPPCRQPCAQKAEAHEPTPPCYWPPHVMHNPQALEAVSQAHQRTQALWEAAEKAAQDAGSRRIVQELQAKDAEWRLQAELEVEDRRHRQVWELLRENLDNATFLIVAKNLGGGHVDVARRIFAGDTPGCARKNSVPPNRPGADGKTAGEGPNRTPRNSSVAARGGLQRAYTVSGAASQAPDSAWRSTESSKLGYTSTKPLSSFPAGARQLRSSLPPKPTWMATKSVVPPPDTSGESTDAPGPGSAQGVTEPRKASIREPSPSVQERVRALESRRSTAVV
mmetsp:Transcript_23151/g.42618  ORF Transcript_23151/g.42618 Transcript_23151/m.42618 type:complete len:319 (-) Transcript_23151:156-1112(-)